MSVEMLKETKINVEKLKALLENPEEPVTPLFLLTVINSLMPLSKDVEIDYAWLNLEKKYGIDVARKDALSAALTFYDNPTAFFSNPNVFDKMSIAFNGHNVITTIINKPTPKEATFAYIEAKRILTDIWHNKYGNKYPLFPDVANFIAAIYDYDGLLLFHPHLSAYQSILSNIRKTPEMNKLRNIIANNYKKYEEDPKSISGLILEDRVEDPDKEYVKNNLRHLIAIDIYCKTMTNYSDSLLEKVSS